MVAKLLDRTNNIKGLLSGWGLSAKPCDICRTASALLYCRADAAFLCGTCDSKMHVATCHGIMAARHERVWMCEVCEQAPAAVTCKADAAVLCTTCDHDIHSANPLSHRHERVPVVPFIDSAIDAAVRSSTSAASSTFLIPDNPITPTILAPIKFNDDDDDYDDVEALLIPNPNSTFLYNDSYILDCIHGGQNLEKFSQKQSEQQSYETKSFAITDSVVPTKSEINVSFSNTADHLFDTSFIDFSQPAKQHNKNNIYNDDNNGQNQLLPSFNFSARNSVSSSDIGVVPEGNMFCNSVTSATTGDSCSTVASVAHATPGLDRVARVLRYREKRKNRKFEKTIRYASRKAYAETRPRIKGRFVKRTSNHETLDDIGQKFGSDIGSGYDFILDQEYGVVPTF